MQASELKGRAVVAVSNAEKIGQVVDVLFDAAFRQVLGFRVKKGGLLGKTEAVPRDSVNAIGADALTVATPDVINDQDRFAELAGAATLTQVEGTKVVTEGGELLGTIAHLEIDDDARKVRSYTLSASLLNRVMRQEDESVKADEVTRLGEGGIMVVADAVGKRLQAQHD
ncbi:MAG: PRC-barrel domain-containing protein [Chloroflexota bacterium]